jgi:hypothetical protein
VSTSGTAAEHSDAKPVIHLSQLLRAPVLTPSGEVVSRVEDVIVRLRGVDEYPLVTGIVAGVGGRVYLVVGALLLVVKAVELSRGSHLRRCASAISASTRQT